MPDIRIVESREKPQLIAQKTKAEVAQNLIGENSYHSLVQKSAG